MIVNNFSRPRDTTSRALTRPAVQLAATGLSSRDAAIFADLHGAMVEQRLLPGMRLIEEELAAIYQASRMRIRRVLLALAQTGMIVLPPGRGAQIACPDATEATSVFRTRRLIEVALLEAATAPFPAEAMANLRVIQADESAAISGQDRAAAIRLSGAFHIALAQAVGNPVIAEIVAGLATRSSLIIALFQRSGAVCCRIDDHAMLIEAVTAGETKRAAVLMRAHLDAIEAGLDIAAQPGADVDLRAILNAG